MPADFLNALTEEIESLEAELLGDPRYAKLASLKRLEALYLVNEPTATSGSGKPIVPDLPSAKPAQRRSTPMREEALAMSEKYLLALPHGLPTPTREIYDSIKSEGVELNGKDPVSNLSAILSQSEKFNSNGRSGWTLASRDAEARAAEQAASDEIADQDQAARIAMRGEGIDPDDLGYEDRF